MPPTLAEHWKKLWMLKITVTPISLAAIAVFTALLPSPVFADTPQNIPAQVAAYEQTLTAVWQTVVHYDILSNFKEDLKQTNRYSSCRPASYCQSQGLQKTLSDLQQGRFTFIAPITLPQNGTELLSAAKGMTACKDLAFMNITHDPFSSTRAPDNPLPEPLRPTEGLGVYRLPVTDNGILIFRGENYQLAWPFWGADQDGPHLPSLDPKVLGGTVSHGHDYMFEVDQRSCRIINQFNYEGFSVQSDTSKSGITLVQKHFSEPIEIDGNIYIIDMDFSRLSTWQGPVISIELDKLDKNSGKKDDHFFFTTVFTG